MPLVRISNTISTVGLDPTTESGNYQLYLKIIEIFPNCSGWNYNAELGVLEVMDTYIPPARTSELGEVIGIDYSFG